MSLPLTGSEGQLTTTLKRFDRGVREAGRVFQRTALIVLPPLGGSRTVLALESRVVIGGPKLKRQLYLYLYLYLYSKHGVSPTAR